MTDKIETDVLVIGSGPISAAFARRLVEGGRNVLIIDGGAPLSPQPGYHLKNSFIFQRNRNHFTSVVQGDLFPLSIPTSAVQMPILDPEAFWEYQAVRNNMNPNQDPNLNMPSAAAAYAVGGMGIHWTCATPRLHPELERWRFIPADEWDRLYAAAEGYFQVSQSVFADSCRGAAIKRALEDLYGSRISPDYPIQNLPVAARQRLDKSSFIHWVAPYDILEPVLGSGRLQILPQHLGWKLHHQSGRVTHAEVKALEPWRRLDIYANEFFVAAGAVLTPQLLWHSDILRGDNSPLGRYLNDQPMVFSQVVLLKKIVDEIVAQSRNQAALRYLEHDPIPLPINDPDPTLWIPVQPGRPWHCQIHKDAFNYGAVPDSIDDRLVVDLRWFGMVEPVYDNHISFSDEIRDIRGMPQPTFHYRIPEQNTAIAHQMMEDMVAAALSFGGFLPSALPQFMPAGASLHYQSTYRMGPADDGTSVVDPYSRVWGFDNLRLGGPGVFPTATAANPTLTASAMAIRAAERLLPSAEPA